MDDLISRQAAIDALADYIYNVDKVYSTGHLSTADCENAARSVLENLPSAQPEPCEDAVSRQAIFDTAAEYERQLCEILGDENELIEVVKILKHRLIALPSAQPEPSQVARDIATIIENEQDMRVVLKNAQNDIVHCRNCKFCHKSLDWKHLQSFGMSIWRCGKCRGLNAAETVNLDDYCSRAERRTDEQT